MVETKIGYTDKVIESQIQIQKEAKEETADFETAIGATGYGKFNLLLLAAIIPSALSQVYEGEGMGYVLPVAQCDLDLTLATKGILNSACQSGMIVSGLFWGYLIDVFGRRRTMVYGYIICTVTATVGGLSQNLLMLILAKFIGGLVITGPFSAAASYLSEYHSKENRARVQLVRGVGITLGSLSLPLIAWAVLPWNLNWIVMDVLTIHSWNLFFFFCAMMPLISSVVFYLLPESPKFLMSAGKNAEALKVLQKVYSVNTGKAENTYPIVHLKNELADSTFSIDPNNRRGSLYVAIHRGLYNLKPLFQKPYVFKLILTCLNVYMLIMGTHTMKFWMPQLLSSANDYQTSHNGQSSNTCDMLDDLGSGGSSNSSTLECSVNFDNDAVYINAAIIGVAQIIGYIFISIIVNFVGKKTISLILMVIAGICSICIYFSPNITVLTTMLCLFITASVLAQNVTMTITMELFPTTMRGSALSFYLMVGRLGSITGNSVFPYLFKTGCLPPFLFLGLAMFAASGLIILYPSTENKSLE